MPRLSRENEPHQLREMTMSKATSESLVDDERVIVTKWVLPSGAETGSHTHGHDYLVVYLSDGTLTVEAEGRSFKASVSKHTVTSRAAGVRHNVSNRSGNRIEFIEIELKR
jgi:quercetin dioxygenase-like cupin family protein